MSKKLTEKKQRISIVALLIVLFAAVGVSLLVFSQAATTPSGGGSESGTSSLSLAPSTASYKTGDAFPVVVKISTPEAVNTVIVDLVYDATKLDFVSIDSSGSAFPTTLQNTGGGGKVTLNYGVAGSSVTGTDIKVSTVNFKVKGGTGSTEIVLANTSHIYKGNAVEVWNGDNSAKSVISLNSSSGGSGGGSGGSTGGTGSGGNSGGTGSSGGGTTSGGGSGTTTNTATGTGGSKPSGSSSTGSNNTPALPSTVSVGDTGASAASVSLLITNADGKPAVGVTVMLANKEAMTNADGIATFLGVAPGKYKVTAKSGVLGASAVSEIVVADGTTAKVQSFTVKLNKSFNFLPYVGIGAGVIALIALLVVGRKKLMEKREQSRHFAGMDNKVYVGGQSDTAELKDPANNLVASLVTPHDDDAAKSEEKEALDSLKSTPKVEKTDTLEQIEKKVGATKLETPMGEAKPAKPADSANFTPNLILPKKAKPTNT